MNRNILFISLLLVGIATSSGQKLTLGYAYPAGGQTGTTFEIEIGGLNISNATEVLISGEKIKGEIIKTKINTKAKKKPTKLDDQSSPQLADRIKVRICIAKNAALGLHDLRLASESGVSNKLNFDVGQYPNFIEEKANQIPALNFITKLPATACGQILPGEVDYFTFVAKKGTILVVNSKARLLIPYIADAVPGWFQPIMKLTNSKGKEIAFNDDYRFVVDPKIITRIAETDTFTLSIHDAIYRGREDFGYRVDIGEIPYLDYCYPCVGIEGKKTTINLQGTNLYTSKLTFTPKSIGYGSVHVQNNKGQVSNSVPFYGLNKTTKLESCPTNDYKLEDNTVVFDSITSTYQAKKFNIAANKNEIIVVEVIARRLGSMLDARLILKDKNDSVVMISDDVEDPTQGLMTYHADPMINFKAKETGIYSITLEDVLGNHGTDYFYLLERKKNVSAYNVFVSPANFSIPRGGTSIIRLDISCAEKSTPALDIDIQGLPKGYLVSNLQTQSGAKSWDISVTAPQNAKGEQLSLHLMTRITNADKSDEIKAVEAVDNMMQAFYYTHHISAASLVADVKEPAAFSIHLAPEIEKELEKPILITDADSVIPMKIFINHKPDFTEQIVLALTRKSKIVTMETVLVEAGETEKTIYLRIDQQLLRKIKSGKIQLSISGSVKPVIDTKGKKRFENAKFKEVSPVFTLQK